MTDGSARVAAVANQRGPGRRTVWGLYRLSKIFVYQHYFGWALAWFLFTPGTLDRSGSVTAMLLFLLGSMGIVTCTCSVDDIIGYRNGSDAMNYHAGGQLRDISGKPLLSGVISERTAVIFAGYAAAVAVVAGTAAFSALNWQVPAESVLIYAAGAFFSVQYSAGLCLSYYPGGAETLLCLASASGLLAPYLAVQGRWSLPAVVIALLLGLWLVMVSSYSNVNDADGDRQVGRRTLAASTAPHVSKSAMVAFFLASVGLTCVLVLAAHWPWWTLLTMLPAVAVHGAQLRAGPARGQWLAARRLGLIGYNLGFLGIGIPTAAVFLS